MFLLGAGASVPLGIPTTKALREQLCDNTATGKVAAEIHQSAAYRFRISEDYVNIEDFLEHLYELELLLWLASRSNLPTVLPRFTGTSRTLSIAHERSAAVHRRVFELVHRTCGDCSGAKVKTLWRDILESIASRQVRIPIFTLNYDWSFEKLAIRYPDQYHLADGFDLLGGTWDPGRFSAKPSSGKINVSLHKLHGSTNWLPDGPLKSMGQFEAGGETEDGQPPRQFEMVYPGHKHEMWMGKEAWQRLSDPSGLFGPSIEREPYKTLREQFQASLRRAHVVVIIGYAFHDERVNEDLIQAINSNKRLKALVVDPGTQSYIKHDDTVTHQPPFHWMQFGQFDVMWSRFTWLRARFGPTRVTRAVIAAINELRQP